MPHGQHVRQVRVDEPDRAADDARVHGRPGRDARRAGTDADPGDRRRRRARDAAGARAVPGRPVGRARPPRRSPQPTTGGPIGLPCMFGDATALPFPDQAFDLVLAIEVLEHVPGPESALAELARVCSGTLVASVPFEPIWRAGNLARRPLRRRAGATRRATSTTGPAGASGASSPAASTSATSARPSPGPSSAPPPADPSEGLLPPRVRCGEAPRQTLRWTRNPRMG